MSFYAQQIISPGSPLHVFWVASWGPAGAGGASAAEGTPSSLARHDRGVGGGVGFRRRLPRRTVTEADVSASVEGIRELIKKSPLALRLTGQLLLGTVRVHAAQVRGRCFAVRVCIVWVRPPSQTGATTLAHMRGGTNI